MLFDFFSWMPAFPGDESLLPTSSKDRTFNHNVPFIAIPFWLPNHQNNTSQCKLSVSSELLLPSQLVHMHNITPPVPGEKALLPPIIKTGEEPTSNSEGLTHSKGCVMQHKHLMVVVQQRSSGLGRPASLYPNTVRSPEPLPAALLPARNLRTDGHHPLPATPQRPSARPPHPGRDNRPAGRGPALPPHSLLLTDLSARAKSPFWPQRFTSLHNPAAAAAAAPAAAAILTPGPDTRRGGRCCGGSGSAERGPAPGRCGAVPAAPPCAEPLLRLPQCSAASCSCGRRCSMRC